MQLSKQHKIYAAVLGLAVAAFGFDRFVLGPGDESAEDAAVAHAAKPAPRRAPARPAVSKAGEPTPFASTTAAQASVLNPNVTLAARLQTIASGQTLNLEKFGDAFRPSAAWVGALRQPAAAGELVDAVAEFQKKKLMAVMKQGNGGVAIIDKTALTVGQTLDGFRLVAVKDRSAILRRGNQRVELRVSDDGLGAMTAPSIPASNGSGSTSEKVAGADTGH